MIASLGPNNSVDFYVQPIGGSGWNHQQVAPPGPSFRLSSIAQVREFLGDRRGRPERGPALLLPADRQLRLALSGSPQRVLLIC